MFYSFCLFRYVFRQIHFMFFTLKRLNYFTEVRLNKNLYTTLSKKITYFIFFQKFGGYGLGAPLVRRVARIVLVLNIFR